MDFLILMMNLDVRIEYKEGRHVSDPCTSTITDPLCSPAPWIKCSTLLIESLPSHLVLWNIDPGAWTLMWPEPHSLKEHERLLQMLACILHTRDCFPAPIQICLPSSDSVPLAALTLSFTGFCSNWAILQLFKQAFFLRKPLACLSPHTDHQCSVFCSSSPWLFPWQPLYIFQVLAQVLWTDVRSLPWLIDQLFNFHQFSCFPVPTPVEPCYVLPVSLGTDDNPRLVWSLYGNY